MKSGGMRGAAWVAACGAAVLSLGTAAAGSLPPLAAYRPGPARAAPGAGLDGQEEVAASAALFDPATADLLLWRAGRFPVPGVATARTGDREAARAAALDTWRRGLSAESPSAAAWSAHLDERLQLLDGDDELWCAAACVAGQLERYDAAPLLARELAPDRPARRRVAAKEALHRLFGRWFTTPDEVVPWIESVRPGPGTRLLLAALDQEETRSRKRLIDVLKTRPDGALEWLADADPRVRADVATLLGQAMASQDAVQRLDPEKVLPPLLARLADEAEPRAFHAELQAALVPLERAPLDAPHLAELRTLLERELDRPGFERWISVARALARLPWRTDPPTPPRASEVAAAAGADPPPAGDPPPAAAPVPPEAWPTSLLEGVRCVGTVLSRVIDPATMGPAADPDAVVGTLEALRTLCDRAKNPELCAALRRSPARAPVFQILQDPRRSEASRTAAVAALGALAEPEDWQLLVDVLKRDDSTPALSHALLGAMRPILGEFGAETPGVDRVLDVVADLTGAKDPDVRRRAVALLGDPQLAQLVGRLPPAFLLARLEQETMPDIVRQLLGLIGTFGHPDMLPALLDLHRFDDLAGGDAELVASLAGALESLAHGDPANVMAVGARLVRADGDKTRLGRIRRALRMAAGLKAESLQQLTPDQHAEVCSWAWELHKAGVSLAAEEGPGFVDRLIRVHLPACEGVQGVAGEPGFGRAARAHLLAVARASQLPENPSPGDFDLVLEDFGKALDAAADDPALALLVRRDRARFSINHQHSTQALPDLRALFEAKALENSDLRTAAELVLAQEGADSRTSARQACAFLLRLVRRDSWGNEPPALRMQDLGSLTSSAVASSDLSQVREVLALFDGLPQSLADPGAATVPAGTPWAGLDRDPERLKALRGLVAQLVALLTATVVPPPPPPAPPSDPTPVAGPPAPTPGDAPASPPSPDAASGSTSRPH